MYDSIRLNLASRELPFHHHATYFSFFLTQRHDNTTNIKFILHSSTASQTSCIKDFLIVYIGICLAKCQNCHIVFNRNLFEVGDNICKNLVWASRYAVFLGYVGCYSRLLRYIVEYYISYLMIKFIISYARFKFIISERWHSDDMNIGFFQYINRLIYSFFFAFFILAVENMIGLNATYRCYEFRR